MSLSLAIVSEKYSYKSIKHYNSKTGSSGGENITGISVCLLRELIVRKVLECDPEHVLEK